MSSIASRRVSEFCNLFVSVVKRNPTGCEALKITVFILKEILQIALSSVSHMRKPCIIRRPCD